MTARAVVLDYDHNHAIRTNQRPPRDCRGPGAFFNPRVRSAGPVNVDDRYPAGADDTSDGGTRADYRYEHH